MKEREREIPSTLFPEDLAAYRQLKGGGMRTSDWLRLIAILAIAVLGPLLGVALVILFK